MDGKSLMAGIGLFRGTEGGGGTFRLRDLLGDPHWANKILSCSTWTSLWVI